MFARALFLIAALSVTKSFVSRALAIRRAIRGLSAPFGGIHLFSPFHISALILGPWFPRAPVLGAFGSKFAPYAKHGSTSVGAVTIHDASPIVWFSDAASIKHITTETSVFQKDVAAYEPLNFYGMNVIGTEGADWRRHRRVSKPAFTEAGNALVWKEAIRVANEWFTELHTRFEHNEYLRIDAGQEWMDITLHIIASAGFGHPADKGQTSAFRQALFTAIAHIRVKTATPTWLYVLSERIYVPLVGRIVRDTQAAYEELKVHILELVGTARAWVIEGKRTDSGSEAALLRNLVEANMDVPEDADRNTRRNTLTESELLSNSFSFLLAGHETTAHTLAFAVGLLALYPTAQQKLFEETVALWPKGIPSPTAISPYKESFARLPYTLAVLHETLRLFPAIIRLGKFVCADTAVPAYHFDLSSTGTAENVRQIRLPLPAGSQVMVDIRALHHNPIHWGADTEEFKPERFIDTESYRWPRDAFAAFSAGPRSCIGQKFALTESVCLLAALVRTFELAVPEPLRTSSFCTHTAEEEMIAGRDNKPKPLSPPVMTHHLQDLSEDVLRLIYSFLNVSSVVSLSTTSKSLRVLATDRLVWVDLVENLRWRGFVDDESVLSISRKSRDELVDLVQRMVLGPRSWRPSLLVNSLVGAVKKAKESIFRPHNISLFPSSESVRLLPGGEYVLFDNQKNLECWAVEQDRLVWTHGHQTGESAWFVDGFAFDMLPGGHRVKVMVSFIQSDTENGQLLSWIDILDLDLVQGSSTTLFSWQCSMESEDEHWTNLSICGSLAVSSLYPFYNNLLNPDTHHALRNLQAPQSKCCMTLSSAQRSLLALTSEYIVVASLDSATHHVEFRIISTVDVRSVGGWRSGFDPSNAVDVAELPTLAVVKFAPPGPGTRNPRFLSIHQLSVYRSPLDESVHRVWVQWSGRQGTNHTVVEVALCGYHIVASRDNPRDVRMRRRRELVSGGPGASGCMYSGHTLRQQLPEGVYVVYPPRELDAAPLLPPLGLESGATVFPLSPYSGTITYSLQRAVRIAYFE
uniref:F-box domain-containing protein n=1 Tax=Mycena chlorophos TaxID=658473 RepID=A0ABQ0M7J1_MYCCL|nr:predicted protein [Mycena chlorophos]